MSDERKIGEPNAGFEAYPETQKSGAWPSCAKSIHGGVREIDFGKLYQQVMEPRPTSPTVPPEQLKAQADAAHSTVREPCPFCGDARPALLEWSHDPFEPDNPLWHAECQGCGAHGPVASSAEDAALRWNGRAAADSLAARAPEGDE